MSKERIKLCVVIPVGPNKDSVDTIESIKAYTSSRRIIVVDDSDKTSTHKNLSKLGSEVIRIKAAPFPGLGGNLWVKLAQGYKYAVEHFRFDVLLRIDTDVLIIGDQPEEDAIKYLKKHTKFGIIGSHKIDYNNQERSFRLAEVYLKKEISIFGLIHSDLRRTLKELVRLARLSGYIYGESCLGGAIFQSSGFTYQMYTEGLFDNTSFKDSKLQEDHIVGLIAYTLGYKLGDFATGPLGLKHKGLPDSPANLLKEGKKIIHSVDYWNDTDERSIREFFRNRQDQLIHFT